MGTKQQQQKIMKIILLAVLLGAAYAQWFDTATIHQQFTSSDCAVACDHGTCMKMNANFAAQCACDSGYRLASLNGNCVEMDNCPNPSNGSSNWALATEAPPAIIMPGGNAQGAFSFVSENDVTNIRVGYENEIRQMREWSLGNLVHSINDAETTTFMAPAPAVGTWKEDNSLCIERHVFQAPWADAISTGQNSGFAGPDDTSEPGNDIYTTYAVVRDREAAADFRGTIIYRHITHAFPLRIKMVNTVIVDDTVNVFAPVNVLAALTASTILPLTPTSVKVTLEIRTQTQAPFYLKPQAGDEIWDGSDLAILPVVNAGVPVFTPPAAADVTLTHSPDQDCSDEHTGTLAEFNAGETYCDQTFTVEFVLDIVDNNGDDINCEADGIYQLKTKARCRDELNANYFDTLETLQLDPVIGCPIIDPATTTDWDGNIDITLDTANYCNDYEIDVGLDGYLGVFEDAARSIERDDFFLQTRIYFRAHLYSTDSNIQLNGATVTEISVTGPVSGSSQLLLPGNVDGLFTQCGSDWQLAIQGNSALSTDASTYNDGTTNHATIKFDFDYLAMNADPVTYSTNGVAQTMSGIGAACGMIIASDENKVLGTTAKFSVNYVGTPASRTTHLTIGEGEEAALLSVSRQAGDGSDSASAQQNTEFVVTVPRGEDNTQTPGAINTGSSKDAASTLSSFLF